MPIYQELQLNAPFHCGVTLDLASVATVSGLSYGKDVGEGRKPEQNISQGVFSQMAAA